MFCFAWLVENKGNPQKKQKKQKQKRGPNSGNANRWVVSAPACLFHNRREPHMSSSKPSIKMVEKADICSYLWLGLSLTNLHLPGFDCGSHVVLVGWRLHFQNCGSIAKQERGCWPQSRRPRKVGDQKGRRSPNLMAALILAQTTRGNGKYGRDTLPCACAALLMSTKSK